MAWELIIITGASKGYGRALATTFAKLALKPVHFVLSGRNLQDLETTATQIKSTATVEVQCDINVADLSDMNNLTKSAAALFDSSKFGTNQYEKVTFINNAGTVGPLSPIGSSQGILSEMTAAYSFNITSCCYLTSEIVRR